MGFHSIYLEATTDFESIAFPGFLCLRHQQNKYLDSLAGLWSTNLGGSEPRLVKAATDQLNKLPFYHSFWNRTTKPTLGGGSQGESCCPPELLDPKIKLASAHEEGDAIMPRLPWSRTRMLFSLSPNTIKEEERGRKTAASPTMCSLHPLLPSNFGFDLDAAVAMVASPSWLRSKF
ncbi:uncharacterized protein LOC119300031 [Triticum dicoccoides]|uniref:uncharacterized protein LOC119300031 n=1 Tax=Triticum dicoccoides TaxID=85692 RepID=UPI00188E4DEE|nr:uncharacterized protein LOC119300031 [Triticum dicoccoides]